MWPLANTHLLPYFNTDPTVHPPLFFLFFLTEGKIKDKGCWQFRATKTDVPRPNLIIESLKILSLHTQVFKKLTGSRIYFEAVCIHNCITGSDL